MKSILLQIFLLSFALLSAAIAVDTSGSLSKNVIVSRGLNYHYLYTPAQPSKPTLLFCHGFPSNARDWHPIASTLQAKGYGVLIPDMLGNGGTAKPTDPAAFVNSLISRDIVDILDAEKLDTVVAVGHDWGSKVISGVANHFPDRVSAYAFFAVPFEVVVPPTNFTAELAQQRAQYGYELYGYWLFMEAPDANAVMLAHMDSFVSILFPNDPAIWKTHFAPTGVFRKSLEENYLAPLPSWMSEGDKEYVVDFYRRGGFPTSWYTIMATGLSQADDEKTIPDAQKFPPARAPIYFGVGQQDAICLPEIGYQAFANDGFKGHNITIKEYPGDHWLIRSEAAEIASDLEGWLENSVLPILPL
ncbi:alpha/beta hydrolase [Phanerochaete sordida]|uniref:Alpha/beta hydrolase n=1 Tax=Phanerochaete sordida TaxID=48140 RepID=A0A9P3LD47_9APHY|nr:alpha/beta hydrolase [Phanerochaete sordida]